MLLYIHTSNASYTTRNWLLCEKADGWWWRWATLCWQQLSNWWKIWTNYCCRRTEIYNNKKLPVRSFPPPQHTSDSISISVNAFIRTVPHKQLRTLQVLMSQTWFHIAFTIRMFYDLFAVCDVCVCEVLNDADIDKHQFLPFPFSINI